MFKKLVVKNESGDETKQDIKRLAFLCRLVAYAIDETKLDPNSPEFRFALEVLAQKIDKFLLADQIKPKREG
jgi:hypothetical protein